MQIAVGLDQMRTGIEELDKEVPVNPFTDGAHIYFLAADLCYRQGELIVSVPLLPG